MEQIGNFFFQQGLLGIIILVLAGVIVWQQKRVDTKDKQISDLQNQRKLDSDAYTASYVTTTREMVGTQRDNLNALNLIKQSVESVTLLLQRLVEKGNL